MKPPAIRVQDLSFTWQGSEPILQSCSLEVPQGEFWMLLGANGSGKSTLLKLLAGLIEPQEGFLEINQTMGFVFQNPDRQLIMPTVGADVAFGLVAENLTPQEVIERVEDSLSAVNLLHLQRRPIYALSGGQKQRIAIAGALARHSQILILDEPTALLDSDAQIDLVVQVKQLVQKRGLTALWVTHRLDELDYSDGAFFLEAGRIVDQGEPQRLKERVMQL